KGCFVCGAPSTALRQRDELLAQFDQTVAALTAMGVTPAELAERMQKGGNRMKTRSIAKAKRAKKMNPVVKALLAVLLVYVAGNMIVTCVKLQVRIQEKQAELKDVTQKISSQTVLNEELNDILNAEVDSAYVESVARDLGYGSVGERVYDNITDE
ncbi:MAG: hypothetical protein IJ294_05640, partial [Clostridia bacterium]|nr:hypothetical protein [Clostridia bacterium]